MALPRNRMVPQRARSYRNPVWTVGREHDDGDMAARQLYRSRPAAQAYVLI